MWESALLYITDKITGFVNFLSERTNNNLKTIVVIILGALFAQKVLTKALLKIAHKTTLRRDIFPTETDRKKRIRTLESLVNTSAHIIIWIIAVILIIDRMGVNTAPLVASAGIIGAALSFGAQSLIKDFLNGFFIITENQYRVGDVVQINTATASMQITGTIEAITTRTTLLRDLDGKLFHIPNGLIAIATNLTMNYARINEDLTISRDTDIDKLEHVINHTGEEMLADPALKKLIIEAPKFVRVERYTENGIVVKVLGKTIAGEQWNIKGEFYRRLIKALEKNHIEVPLIRFSIKSEK